PRKGLHELVHVRVAPDGQRGQQDARRPTLGAADEYANLCGGQRRAADSLDHLGRVGFRHLQLVLTELRELTAYTKAMQGKGGIGATRQHDVYVCGCLLDEDRELVEDRAVAHGLDVVEHQHGVLHVVEVVEQ